MVIALRQPSLLRSVVTHRAGPSLEEEFQISAEKASIRLPEIPDADAKV